MSTDHHLAFASVGIYATIKIFMAIRESWPETRKEREARQVDKVLTRHAGKATSAMAILERFAAAYQAKGKRK
jgi:hypothetical protein